MGQSTMYSLLRNEHPTYHDLSEVPDRKRIRALHPLTVKNLKEQA